MVAISSRLSESNSHPSARKHDDVCVLLVVVVVAGNALRRALEM